MQQQHAVDTPETAQKGEQQHSYDKFLSSIDDAAQHEHAGTAMPQSASLGKLPPFLSGAPSHRSLEQAAHSLSETSAKAADRAELAASKAAATALPDSDSNSDSDDDDDDDEEDSQESSTAESTEESDRGDATAAPLRRPQLASVAQAAGRAAATPLPDSDEEAEDDLESQASASVAPPAQAHARAPVQGFGQSHRGAALPRAAESAAPGQRLGRLDSLSASDTESVEVQSRPKSTWAPAAQPAKEVKPASTPWSFGTSAAAFGQGPGPRSSSSAATAAATLAPTMTDTAAPAFLQPKSISKPDLSFTAPRAATSMARQSSSSLPPFSPQLPKPAQASRHIFSITAYSYFGEEQRCFIDDIHFENDATLMFSGVL